MAKEHNEYGLTDFQERFCREYVSNGNIASEAFLSVHHKAHNWKNSTVRTRAYELMQLRVIKDRIAMLEEERVKRLAKKHNVDDDRITREYARIAFFDIRQVFNDDGTLKAPHEIEDDVAAGLFTIEVNITESIDVESGKKIKTKVTSAKVKAINKIDALRDLGKHIGYFAQNNSQQKPETFIYNKIELPAHIRQGIPAMHDESV